MRAIIGIFALAMAFNAQAGFFNIPENTTETQACTCETQAVSPLDIKCLACVNPFWLSLKN